MYRRFTLHFVEPDSRMRAELARLARDLGHHGEVYADLAELVAQPPRDGLVIAGVDLREGGAAGVLQTLGAAGIWQPLIAASHSPDTGVVVGAIKAGALDFLALPVERAALVALLARVGPDVATHAEARRRMIAARERIAALSSREREVLDWLAGGASNKAIARELAISPRTVEIHRANMMGKLGARHAADAVRLRFEARLEPDAAARRAGS